MYDKVAKLKNPGFKALVLADNMIAIYSDTGMVYATMKYAGPGLSQTAFPGVLKRLQEVEERFGCNEAIGYLRENGIGVAKTIFYEASTGGWSKANSKDDPTYAYSPKEALEWRKILPKYDATFDDFQIP